MHWFLVDRSQCILWANTRSLDAAVTFGTRITNDGQFIERALSSIRAFMEDNGYGAACEQFIAPAGGTVEFVQVLDRSATCSMYDITRHAACRLATEEVSPFEIGSRLMEIPMSALQ